MNDLSAKYTKGMTATFGGRLVTLTGNKIFNSNANEWLYEVENTLFKFKAFVKVSELNNIK